MLFFNLTNRDGDEPTLVLTGSFGQRSITPVHPNFQRLVEYMTGSYSSGVEIDEAYVESLVDPTKGIAEAFADIDVNLTVDLHNVYYMGVPVSGGLAEHLMQRVTEGADWERFARFLVNLEANPSARAKDALFDWVTQHGVTITEDGRFLGYKAVANDGLSKHSGPNNFINGVLFGEPGEDVRVPHEIGTVISKRRGDVDDDTSTACSTGLHVGSEEYTRNFAERLLTVAVNPADVVSVPEDGTLDWKIRVCQYEVINLADPKQFASTSYNLGSLSFNDGVVSDYEDEYDADEDYQRDLALGVLDVEPEDIHDEVEEDEFTEQDGMGQAVLPVQVDKPSAPARYPNPSSTYKGMTLAQVAERIPDLKADLASDMGHKPLARKWSAVTTESSVRRYRKNH